MSLSFRPAEAQHLPVPQRHEYPAAAIDRDAPRHGRHRQRLRPESLAAAQIQTGQIIPTGNKNGVLRYGRCDAVRACEPPQRRLRQSERAPSGQNMRLAVFIPPMLFIPP